MGNSSSKVGCLFKSLLLLSPVLLVFAISTVVWEPLLTTKVTLPLNADLPKEPESYATAGWICAFGVAILVGLGFYEPAREKMSPFKEATLKKHLGLYALLFFIPISLGVTKDVKYKVENRLDVNRLVEGENYENHLSGNTIEIACDYDGQGHWAITNARYDGDGEFFVEHNILGLSDAMKSAMDAWGVDKEDGVVITYTGGDVDSTSNWTGCRNIPDYVDY